MDGTQHPPIIEQLHFEFEGWLNDDILETYPCFLVTERLRAQIEIEKLSGILFDSVQVTKSDNFKEMYPGRQLPKFYWAKITGDFAQSDFFLVSDGRLAVSDKAYRLLCRFNIRHADIEEMH